MKIAEVKEAIERYQREHLIGEITVYLPEPPKDYKTIANWDLPKEAQKFQYTKQPRRSEDPSEDFLIQEAKRFKNGYWLFINGELYWFTPFYYFFLNYWTDKGKQMRFVDSQMTVAWWIWQIERMDNMMGGNLVTNRRFGKSVFGTAWAYFRTVTNPFHRTGMQSKTNQDVKLLFGKLIKSWQKLASWLKPVDAGESRPASVLEFSEPRKRDTKGEKKVYANVLDSSIDFRSSEEDGYDGDELGTYLEDECHTAGVEVLMFDGSIKKVEDVIVGDLLMGDDSTSREVLELKRGEKKCYEIVPKAGGWQTWGCTENHVLSVIYSNKNRQNRFTDGEVYNIPVSSFLKLTKTDKRHFSLYRREVQYQNREVKIDPYILGTWLGDGTQRLTQITTPDEEVRQAWSDYADKIDQPFGVASIGKGCVNYKIIGNGYHNNEFLNMLRSYGLTDEKHIPHEYLINTREVRLQLLAGLIDSDGYKNEAANYWEIIQKRKDLSYQIQRLASELGFKCNMVEKIATMKRDDGSVYKCLVYRIGIFGLNLWEVPCRVARKIIYSKERHKNSRDSQKTSLTINDIGIQPYFGFKVSGNSLYMLKDCTVTHNCGKAISVNTDIRWGVVQFCMLIGASIVGKALRTTTVEEMERRGGKHFKKTWDDSLISTLNPTTGRTNSMLTNLFIPADFGFSGHHPITKEPFVDEYGMSNRALAQAFILSLWENLEGEKLLAAQRKNPLTLKHAFQLANNSGTFESEIYEYLDIQKEYINGTSLTGERMPVNLRRQVSFYRDVDGYARWKADPKGHSAIIWDFEKPNMANARKVGELNQFKPMNAESFCGGCDPFAATIVSGPGSMGVLYIYRKSDELDPENSGIVIAMYSQRTRMVDDFHKNVMIICQYYGCKVNYESDVNSFYETFIREGYRHYVMWTPKIAIDPTKRNHTPRPGTLSKDPFAFQKQFQILVEYLYARWHKIYFIEIIEQLIDFDVNDRTKSDHVIAFTMALLGGWTGGSAPVKDTRTPTFIKFKESQRTPGSKYFYQKRRTRAA